MGLPFEAIKHDRGIIMDAIERLRALAHCTAHFMGTAHKDLLPTARRIMAEHKAGNPNAWPAYGELESFLMKWIGIEDSPLATIKRKQG